MLADTIRNKMQGKENLEKFIEHGVKGLCNYPDAVSIEATKAGDNTLVVVIHCDRNDVALVLGRQGKHIGALRSLCWAIATKDKIKITIVLDE